MGRADLGVGVRVARLLLIGVLGTLAIASASPAAARASSEWVIEGETFSALSLKEETISGNGGPITLRVPGANLQLECKKASLSGVIFSGGTDKTSTSLSECKVMSLKGESLPCAAAEPVVLKTKSELALVKEAFYEKFEAQNAEESISNIVLKGAECVLPKESLLNGSFAGQASAGEQVERSIELSEKADKEAGTKLLFGKLEGHLSGKLGMKISGANAGKEWQRVPATKLCNQLENACAAPYGVGSAVKAEKEGEMQFKYGGITVVCKRSKLEGATQALAAGSFNVVEFTECKRGAEACPVTALNKPYKFDFVAEQLGDGKFTLRNPTLEIVCAGITCIYKAAKAPFDFEGAAMGKASRAAWGAFVRQPGSNAACNVGASWEGTPAEMGNIKYKFTAPAPLFLTL